MKVKDPKIASMLFNDHVFVFGKNEYKLRRVTEAELLQIRIKNKPGVVFKDTKSNGEVELWYAPLSSGKVKLCSVKHFNHCCNREKDCCKRLIPLPDPQGCKSVRDLTMMGYRRAGYRMREACKYGFRIEKYGFIIRAIETIGCEENGFKCIECKNCAYDPVIPRSRAIENEYLKQQQQKAFVSAKNDGKLSEEELKELVKKFTR
ncbi:MAG: hypothetical protein IJ690_05250 [Clostridia bacterium]|nr:hypothetical protein [Clostridia bacterium]